MRSGVLTKSGKYGGKKATQISPGKLTPDELS